MMEDVECPICGNILYEEEPGVDNFFDDDDDITRSYIVRELSCDNRKCPLFGKRLDVFYDYNRIDVDGDEIDLDELRKEFHKIPKKKKRT